MKKILVPTDFSENANLALRHAIQVANKFGATLYILHAYLVATSTGNLVSIDHIVKADREEELAALISEIKPLLDPKTQIVSQVIKGISVESICNAAEKLKVDIIIMGTKGADGMKKIFLGSTASNVILHTTIPVLVIPSVFESFKISNITLALDDKEIEDSTVLKPILDFIKGFDAVLDLLSVIDEDHPKAKIDRNLEEYFNKEGVTYTYFIVKAPNIVEGIRKFVARESSDMLCLIHHSRGFFQNIFGASVTKEMTFDSSVPILVLRG
ncbi:MAG: universal stress protein [Algoriphagus sp.]|nr:universal stress protein [Algoriphagus sp.]